MTTPGRFSVEIPELNRTFHSTSIFSHTGVMHNDDYKNNGDVEDMITNACRQYLQYVFDPEIENLIGKSLSHYFLNTIPNLMIIPCFFPPLDSAFNLYELCTKELKTFFPKKEVNEIYKSYADLRMCHLTEKNNEILAELINSNLKSGIFVTEYSNFSFENMSLESMLRSNDI
jgi:hypothetical protein